jgi:hypothetical protein
MTWKFDQGRNVACITCRSVMNGRPVLIVTHYEDDHSWGFLDGGPNDGETALIVAMSEVVERHPDLVDIATLPPGWSATRAAPSEPWLRQQDQWTQRLPSNVSSTRSPCASISGPGKPWTSKKHPPIDYRQCCDDPLNPPPDCGRSNSDYYRVMKWRIILMLAIGLLLGWAARWYVDTDSCYDAGGIWESRGGYCFGARSADPTVK